MLLRFEHGAELEREVRRLPAEHYNKIHLLFARSHSDSLMIPIRGMQYLAVIDPEEIVFVDGQGPRSIELAWRDFHPGGREDLRTPVAYTCIYYEDKGHHTMVRLQGEFYRALELFEGRQAKSSGATITPLGPRGD